MEEGSASPAARRSERPRKSRIVIVHGQPVRREDLYTIKEGGISVFDESKRDLPEGVEDYESYRRKKMAKRKIKKKTPNPAASPKTRVQNTELSDAARERQKRHAELAADMAVAAQRRFSAFATFRDVLKPFVTESVLSKITTNRTGEEAGREEVTLPARRKTIEQPGSVRGTMRSYQLEGLAFLVSAFENGLSAILADEMGLGKTLQAISFLGYLKFDLSVSGPHLVVCPLSVLGSWRKELARWCPALRVLQLHSADRNERDRVRKELMIHGDRYDIVLTTYDTLVTANMKRPLQQSLHWRYLILDEGHRVKNEKGFVSDCVSRIKRQGTLVLTGTPVQNNLHELWVLLNVLHPGVFTDPTPFDSAFNVTGKDASIDKEMLAKARLLLNKFYLRRLKADAEKDLPPKMETKIYCPLSKMQHFWYKRLLLKESHLLAQLEATASGEFVASKEENSWRKLLMLLAQLRKCASHPYMFAGAEKNPEVLGEDIVQASGKMQLLDRLLKKLKSAGHRVVLFSQLTNMLNIIEDYAFMRGYKFVRIDGSIGRVQREVNIRLFNHPNSEYFIFLVSTRAGGLGINLQTADTVVIFDSDWNPQVDIQATARVHRIGQTKPVHVYRLVTNGTVEEQIQARAEARLYLDRMVNRGSIPESEDVEAASSYEVLSMIRFGAEAMIKSDDTEELTDEDLDMIIDRTRGEVHATGKEECSKLQNCQHNAAEFNPQLFPCYSSKIFEGTDYSKVSTADIRKEWEQTSKRTRVSTLIEVNGYKVKRCNNYFMEEGEPSVFGRELHRAPEVPKQSTGKKRVEKHEDHCLYCWDGGFLVVCDYCPAAYHLECMGINDSHLKAMRSFSCPHHQCSICDRKTAMAGGMLFPCEVCPNAYCDEHLPEDVNIVRECGRFQKLEYNYPNQQCFIQCSDDCIAFAAKLARGEDIYAHPSSQNSPFLIPKLEPHPPSPPLSPQTNNLTPISVKLETVELPTTSATTHPFTYPSSSDEDTKPSWKKPLTSSLREMDCTLSQACKW